MNQRIIYPQETGIAVITPTGELSLEETALKDVPSGVKYKIIDASDLPANRDFRDAWEYDFSTDFDGVGA
jgi:homogentisate 1,2-dioxygenase